MSWCGEKALVTNLCIARKFHDIKAKKYVPVNVWRWLVGELVTSGEKDMLHYWEHGPERLVGKWSEHGRRARVIYNLETLETSNGIRTNVLQQKLGLVSHTTNTMLGLTQYPQGLGLVSHTANMWQISNLQIDSSVIQIVHQMFYATQSILRPLSRTYLV